MRTAAILILEFTGGQSLETFRSSTMLRSAVERQFEIVGEPIGQLARSDTALEARIPDAGRSIDFRKLSHCQVS